MLITHKIKLLSNIEHFTPKKSHSLIFLYLKNIFQIEKAATKHILLLDERERAKRKQWVEPRQIS